MGWIAPLIVFGMLALPAFRLWRIPAAERGDAERVIAAFFLLSALGLSLRLLGVGDHGAETAFQMSITVIGHACLSLACIALYVFTRKVFRPTEGWARRVLELGSAGTAASFFGLFLDGGFVNEERISVLFANGFRTGSYLWCFAESLRYWRLMRRRLEIGLADPVVANRFALWSVWTGGLSLCLGVVLAMRIVGRILDIGMEVGAGYLVPLRIVMLAIVAVSMLAIWLSFFPPRRYRRWLTA